MTILVIAEHNNAVLAAATLNTVAAAKRIAAQAIGGDIHVLVAGSGCGAIGEAAAQIEGVAKVLVADDAAYTNQLPENVAPLIADLAKNYSHVLAAATTNGKNFLPRALPRNWTSTRSPRSSRWKARTPSSARSTLVTPSPPCNPARRSR